ncbi:MAG: DUF6763 family protein [Halieaceae bacterium]
MKSLGPVVGTWYKDLQTGATFEVVAWDPAGRTVETQHIDGEVSEYDLDSWRQLLLVNVEEPEDWRNPYELDGEESHDPDLPYHPEDWSGPINNIEPEYMIGVEDF